MEQETFAYYVLGGLTVNYILAFYFFSIFGMTLALILDYTTKRARKKRTNKLVRFSLRHSIKDNWVRVFGNVMIVFAILRFSDKFFPEIELDMWLGFIIGLSIDSVVILLRRYTKIKFIRGVKDNV